MLAIIAAVLWIVFDVVATVLTAPTLPTWQWYAIVYGGTGVALFTVITGYLEWRQTKADKATADQKMTSLREQLIRQEGMMQGIGITSAGTLQILTTGQAQTSKEAEETLKSAIVEIGKLEMKVSRYEAIFWKPLDDEERKHLVATLIGLGKHSVQITAHENTDCAELARDLRDCFEQAGWFVAKIPLTGTWGSAGASGFLVRQKAQIGAFNKMVFDALVRAAQGPIQGLLIDKSDAPDVYILVGTKRLSND
jgi:hypothetical protein